MAIHVHSPAPRNLELLTSTELQKRNKEGSKLRSSAKQEEMDQIREKLCQSPLYEVFQSTTNKEFHVQKKTKGNGPEQEKDKHLTSVGSNDWKPVVCKQT